MKIIINAKTISDSACEWSMDIIGFDEELRGRDGGYIYDKQRYYKSVVISSVSNPELRIYGQNMKIFQLFIWGNNISRDRNIKLQSLEDILEFSNACKQIRVTYDLTIKLDGTVLFSNTRSLKKLMEYING